MLWELALGDAYGAGFEFKSEAFVAQNNTLAGYFVHGLGGLPGRYTDDTQMSIALVELLVSGEPWHPQAIADAFVRCFKRDPRPGYAEGFQQFLQEVHTGREFLRKIRPNSTRNGAAMRASPLGLVGDIDRLLEMSRIQAQVTHDTAIGIKSAQAIALICHYLFFRKGSREGLLDFVCQHTAYAWQADWTRPVACCAEETVNAVLTVLSKGSSFTQILRASVAFCGDVDTVAALALAAASLSSFYLPDLPPSLVQGLEADLYGIDFLRGLDVQLLARAGKY